VSYINREDAEKAVAEYLRSEDVKRYGRPRLATHEYIGIAKDILRDVQNCETDKEG